MSYKVAVIGATGNVGREVLRTLEERNFPVSEVVALASSRSIGIQVSYGEEQTLTVSDVDTYDFTGTDLALFSAGAQISKQYAPRAAATGCIVIDNTSHFRMDPDIPLVVPEVNEEALAGYGRRNIIANPNCATMQLVVALKPLHDAFGIERVVVSTYQSTSGSGKAAMDELFTQTRAVFVNDPITPRQFTKQIAFNVIPHIDVFMDDGSTKEEWKMAAEVKKILDPAIRLTATCVRVPVFVGHAEAVNIQTTRPISSDEVREILRDAPGIAVVDHRADEGYVTPQECAGEDSVFISRIRDDFTVENGLNFWCVSDNLRKGAALNAVQIAETLIAQFLRKAA